MSFLKLARNRSNKGVANNNKLNEKKLLRDFRRERRPSNWFVPVARFKSASVERGSIIQDLLDFLRGNRWDRMRKPSIVLDETG